jgi:hypothetical protein
MKLGLELGLDTANHNLNAELLHCVLEDSVISSKPLSSEIKHFLDLV